MTAVISNKLINRSVCVCVCEQETLNHTEQSQIEPVSFTELDKLLANDHFAHTYGNTQGHPVIDLVWLKSW